jgi:hypothetical protein
MNTTPNDSFTALRYYGLVGCFLVLCLPVPQVLY